MAHAVTGASEPVQGRTTDEEEREMDDMTTEDASGRAAALTSGASFWTTVTTGRGDPVVLTDGPHGVRRQTAGEDHLGIAPSEPATCFPPAVSLAQSWDPELVERVGAALGDEARVHGVGVLLGPGINIKRDPRGGRNFEYLSEDPFLTGTLATSWVRGLQSRGVGASVKHFAVNNAEDDRMRASSEVASRPLREIYLRAFQRVVQEADPWTVMCSYNRINGVFASENRWLLTEVLRDEWGFEGVVVSDWGAVRDRVAALAAGLDLAMPGPDPTGDAAVAAAAEQGRLTGAAVQTAAARVTALNARVHAGRAVPGPERLEVDAHHELAREAAARSIVLLKNEGGLLPLPATSDLAVIGEFAVEPRYQGGGSSHVVPTRVDVPADELRALLGDAARLTVARGFRSDGQDGAALLAEAVRVAQRADAAVLFLGLAETAESEGFDRTDIELPAAQLELARAVLEVQPRTVVVLAHGGVLRLAELAATVPAILDGGLLGQGGGHAVARVLLGVAGPSGRLAETVPVRLQDTPAYLSFTPVAAEVTYGEGVFVGYRWYDARELEVTYPFGHGLTYTTFAYDDLELRADDTGITARVTIRNTGRRAGTEVVQLYAVPVAPEVPRALRELVGYATVRLEPGQTETVEVEVRRGDLAYWETRLDAWRVQGGAYRVDVGASSRDIRLTGEVLLEADRTPIPLTLDSTIGEVMADPRAAAALAPLLGAMRRDDGTGDALGMDMARMIASMPVGKIAGFPGSPLDADALQALLAGAAG